jgi:hypothetical protein
MPKNRHDSSLQRLRNIEALAQRKLWPLRDRVTTHMTLGQAGLMCEKCRWLNAARDQDPMPVHLHEEKDVITGGVVMQPDAGHSIETKFKPYLCGKCKTRWLRFERENGDFVQWELGQAPM